MPIDIVIPTVGESITSGVLAKWLKADGEPVARDEVVAELETDKVTMELRSPAEGVLKRLAKEGDTVAVGASVGSVDPSGTPTARAGSPAVAAQAAGKGGAATAVAPPPPKTPARPPEPTPADHDGDVRATPLARKIAAEQSIDLSKIQGTGAGGRVREQDVLAYVQSKAGAEDRGGAPRLPAPPSPASPPIPPIPMAAPVTAPSGPRGVTRERMTPLRQRIATRLVESQHAAAMLTTFNECDMSAVLELRKQYKEDFEKKHGVGLGFMSFFVKAAVHALRAFPLVNAFIVEENGQPAIEKHGYCDIAVAVSTPKGLVVPVVRDCQTLGFAQIESAIKDLATRARDGKLTLEELQGGTFTITNGGIFGSLMSTPILNPPQSAILGMHATKNRAVEDPRNPGQIVLRPMMYLAMSYDHRIIDGAEAVRFLLTIKQAIEDPQRLLLEL